jgi:hypothetical protein
MLIVLAKTPPALSGLSQQRFSALALPGANGSGGACLLCPGSSDVNLFCYGKGIIDLDAGAPDGTYDFGVTEQELHGSCAAEDDHHAGRSNVPNRLSSNLAIQDVR